MNEIDVLRNMYRDFNARNIEHVLARMSAEVAWANGMEGGHVHGVDAVREYWLRQFAMLSPNVEPVDINQNADGRYEVRVHQTVHDLEGKLLLDTEVRHFYTINGGFIERMDIGSSSAQQSGTFVYLKLFGLTQPLRVLPYTFLPWSNKRAAIEERPPQGVVYRHLP